MRTNRRIVRLVSCLVLLTVLAAERAYSHGGGTPDPTEGGHMDTEFGVLSLGEWWYFNGDLTLLGGDGPRKLSFFLAGSHQESALFQTGGAPASYLNRFRGLYLEDGTTRFDFQQTFVPRATIADHVAFGTPYLSFTYPDRALILAGSAHTGYWMQHETADAQLALRFWPRTEKAVSEAGAPLRYTTQIYGHGSVYGTVVLDGVPYIAHGSGYFDHMMPLGETRPWAQTMHGWSWSEVTTRRYQAVLYAIRGLSSGYSGYDHKQLTLIDRRTGRIIAQYAGEEVTVTESDWIEEPTHRRRRPLTTVYEAGDSRVTVHADPDAVVRFDTSDPVRRAGFVDFMAHERGTAVIERSSQSEVGNSFFEYLVTEMGLATTP